MQVNTCIFILYHRKDSTLMPRPSGELWEEDEALQIIIFNLLLKLVLIFVLIWSN